MADITMCEGKGCTIREICYRYIADPSERQSYFLETPSDGGTDCEFFYDYLDESFEFPFKQGEYYWKIEFGDLICSTWDKANEETYSKDDLLFKTKQEAINYLRSKKNGKQTDKDKLSKIKEYFKQLNKLEIYYDVINN